MHKHYMKAIEKKLGMYDLAQFRRTI